MVKASRPVRRGAGSAATRCDARGHAWMLAVLLAPSTLPAQSSPQAPAAGASQPPAVAASAQPHPSAVSADGGTIHGQVKSGETPLPGVRVTAANTLTGTRYSTTTDVAGTYRLVIPATGRYVLRTEFVAFASTTREALLNATTHDVSADFLLTLQSRVATLPEDRGELGVRADNAPGRPGRGAGRSGGGGQTLNLLSAMGGALEAGQVGSSGTQLPSPAGSADFSSSESVAVSGSSGATNSFAGINLDDVRQRAESDPSLSPGGQGADQAQAADLVEGSADLALDAVDAADLVASTRTSPTARSSGTAATRRSMPATSPFAASRSRSRLTPPTDLASSSQERPTSHTSSSTTRRTISSSPSQVSAPPLPLTSTARCPLKQSAKET